MFHLLSIKPDTRAARVLVVTMETVLRVLVRLISFRSLKIELTSGVQEICVILSVTSLAFCSVTCVTLHVCWKISFNILIAKNTVYLTPYWRAITF